MKHLIITAGLLCLIGCASVSPSVWIKAGATQTDRNTDQYDCEKDARQSGYFGTGVVGTIEMQKFFDKCMVARGWHPEPQRTLATPLRTVEPATDPVRSASEACKTLYGDERLNPLRGVVAFDALPTLEMQANAAYVTGEQKIALSVYQQLFEQCREKLMAASPELAQFFERIGDGDADLLAVYNVKMTIGEFNHRRAQNLEKLKAVLLRLSPPSRQNDGAIASMSAAQQAARPIDYCRGAGANAYGGCRDVFGRAQ